MRLLLLAAVEPLVSKRLVIISNDDRTSQQQSSNNPTYGYEALEHHIVVELPGDRPKVRRMETGGRTSSPSDPPV